MSQYDEDGSIAFVMKQASKQPMLSREEEKELAFAWFENKDRKARDRLISSYTRLAIKLARSYGRDSHHLEDVVSTALLGLSQALETFDPNKGSFTTHMTFKVKANIRDYNLNNRSLVKMGTTATQKRIYSNLERAKRDLGMTDTTATIPEDILIELADRLNTTPKEVEEMNNRMCGDISSNLISCDNGSSADSDSGTEIQDYFADPDTDTEADYVKHDEHIKNLSLLEIAKQVLSGREKMIFEERRISDPPKTLDSIGRGLGVSREWVRQIEAIAFKKVQDKMLELKAKEQDNDI